MRSGLARLVLPSVVAALAGGCGGAPATPGTAPAVAPVAAPAAPAPATGPRIRLAVGSFAELEAAKALFQELGWAGLGPLLTEQITTGLVQTGRVVVLERSQIRTVVGNTQLEKESDLSRYFDASTTVEAGGLLGAQATLVGVVTRFEPNVERTGAGLSLPGVGALSHHEDKAIVGIEVRLVDQKTGRVLRAAEGEATILTRELGGQVAYKGLSIGSGQWSRTPLGAATRAAGDAALARLLESLRTLPWETAVADVRGPEKVFLSAGSDLDVQVGQRFRIVHVGEPVKGPDGTVIAQDETEGGWVEVVSVQPGAAIARVTEGEPPRAGDKVRHVP